MEQNCENRSLGSTFLRELAKHPHDAEFGRLADKLGDEVLEVLIHASLTERTVELKEPGEKFDPDLDIHFLWTQEQIDYYDEISFICLGYHWLTGDDYQCVFASCDPNFEANGAVDVYTLGLVDFLRGSELYSESELTHALEMRAYLVKSFVRENGAIE